MQSKRFLCQALGLVDNTGYTVLHHASAHGAAAFISLLFDIAAVAHPNLSAAQLCALTDRREPKRGLAPLHFAGTFPHSVANTISNHSMLILPLCTTVMNQHTNAVAALLNSGHASPNIPDFDGRSPLHMAVDQQNAELVRMLLEFGANPNQADVEGATPLHEACSLGNAAIACLLLQNGAYVDVKDHEGEEPVFYAVREHHVEVVKVLAAYGCEMWKCVNEDGETPLDLSMAIRDSQMTKFLRENFSFPALQQQQQQHECGDDVAAASERCDEELMDVDHHYSTQFGAQMPCI